MARVSELFSKELQVLNVGTRVFEESLKDQGVQVLNLDWQPPAGGNPELAAALDKLLNRLGTDEANAKAIDRLQSSQAVLVDLQTAIDVIPGMTRHTILHAGPPITWDKMSGPLRGAVIGGLIYEGLAAGEEEAIALASSGKIIFSPCHEHDAVGPMAGVVTASMPMFIVENKTHGNRAHCTINEGLGKVLRYGAYGPEVIQKLKWMEQTVAPVLQKAIRASGGIDVKTMVAQAMHMGDECHNRNKAGTSLFIRAITPHLMRTGFDQDTIAKVFEFITGNDHFFLNLSMPAAKAMLEACNGIPGSTLVVTMARNGTEFGIRVSGLPGKWFTAPAEIIQGLFFPGYSADDANPDIGDSAITETCGFGGFAMAGAPAIVQFVGGTPADALRYSQSMYEITLAESRTFSIPTLNFRGSPTGIDIRKVIETGTLPIINTGIAHKKAGVGQVGAGVVRPPRACFEKALLAAAENM